MHDYDLILTLTSGLAVALALGYLTHRLGLSPIVGYLVAGVCVGPYTPGYVADAHLAEQMAEIGVILLMFGVGLQFHLDELLAVRRVAVPGALAQSGAATILGALLAVSVGWSWAAGLVFGMALAVASTVVLIRVLADRHDLHTRAGHIAVGWLVVEDLLTVLALVLLPVVVAPAGQGLLGTALLLTFGKVAALIAFTAVVGTWALPRILDHVARTRSRELFTLTVLVIALGIAVGAALVFSVSMALGAFLAGLVVGRSEYSLRAASEALPLRDAFAVLFFVSVGMLLDPGALLGAPRLLAGTLAIVLVAKPVVAFAIVWLLRYPLKVSLSVAIALAQIGEFSFILASLGRELGVLDVAATNTLVAASILSIVVNPLLYGAVEPVERWLSRRPRWRAILDRSRSAGPEVMAGDAIRDDEHRAVVVGYGPTGRTLARLLAENDIRPTVIELNIDTVRAVREAGGSAIYGEASDPATLEAAGVRLADTLILSASGLANGPEVIRVARALNPRLTVLARAAYLREVEALRAAGADTVYSGEGEVALAFTEHMLERLGATAEQIERERARARDALAGRPVSAPA